jgi:hypothetical protein
MASKNSNLHSLTVEEINQAVLYQKDKIGWDFYSERQFTENLFSTRFNYLIGIFSLFIAASASVKTQSNLIGVLILGTILTLLISLTIYRIFIRLIIILKILYKLDDNHVFPMIDREIKAIGKKAFIGVNQIVGIYIPLFCTSVLFVLTILAVLGILKAQS